MGFGARGRSRPFFLKKKTVPSWREGSKFSAQSISVKFLLRVIDVKYVFFTSYHFLKLPLGQFSLVLQSSSLLLTH